MFQSKQVGNGLNGQDIGIEVDDLGKLSEPERVKFGQSRGEVGPSCKGMLELTCNERSDIN